MCRAKADGRRPAIPRSQSRRNMIRLRLLRNLRERRPFSPHGYETRILAFMCVDGGLRGGERTGTTWPFDTPGPNRAAIA